MIVHCDGSCYWKDRRMGVGIAFFEDENYSPFKEEAIAIIGLGSSNEAEYHAILQALYVIINMSYLFPKNCEFLICSDSEIVTHQITGYYRCNKETLQKYLKEVLSLVIIIEKNHIVNFQWIPRTDKRQQIVDVLSKKANPYFNERIIIDRKHIKLKNEYLG